jgi:GTPase SAR1 family protein
MERDHKKNASGAVTRQGLFMIIIGTNGTGKTTFLRELLESSPRRTLAVDPDGMEWDDYTTIPIERTGDLKDGAKARVIAPQGAEFQYLMDLVNANLILDDCRYYVKPMIEGEIRKTLVRRRQRALDIFAVAHSFNEIPPTFWVFATHIVLFKTTDNLARKKENMPRFEQIKEIASAVNSSSDPHHYEIINLR